MPCDSRHPQYTRHLFQWKKCRDSVEGSEAIKGAGQLYLAQLDQMLESEYAAYKDRALFYGASDRTVKALTGAVMRRPPLLQNFPEVPSTRDPEKVLKDNLGSRGEPFELICKKIVEEVVTTGRLGVYVDSDPDEGAAEAGADPYLCLYYAENIINWGERSIGGRKELEFVVLFENEPRREMDDNQDMFEYRQKERWRVLRMEGMGTPEARFKVEVWERRESESEDDGHAVEEDDDAENFELISEVYPTFRGGRPIPFIPFRFINPSDNTVEIEKPPILDLVNVNLSHYKNSADYEHGLHFTALPTAWVSGFNPDSTRLRIGSSIAWVSENVQAHAGFLEFSGHGLGAIATAMDKKERQMAVLGARLLEEQKADSEAAAALRLRHSGEESVLQHIVKSIDEALEHVLRWVAQWVAQPSDGISCKLNEEFNPLGIDPQSMIVMMNMVQSGDMSWDTLYFNLHRGNVYPDGWTAADEKDKIEAGRPLPPMVQVPEDVALKGSSGQSGGRMGAGGSLSAGEGSDFGGGL